MKVTMTQKPSENDWKEVKRRARATVGRTGSGKDPEFEWRHSILEARHSPIRYLRFSFDLEIPYWVSVHLCRHVHSQPYVQSQRNDRQSMYDRNTAQQDAPVLMIWDMNAEELMTIANKRLCSQASSETRAVVAMMCSQVLQECPEFEGLLVPICEYQGGVCHEMRPCGKCDK